MKKRILIAVVKGRVIVKIAFWGRFYAALIRCKFSGEEYHSTNSLTVFSSWPFLKKMLIDAPADGLLVHLGAGSRNIDHTKSKAQRP